MPKGSIRTTDSPVGRIRTTDSPTGYGRYSGILSAAVAGTDFAGKGYLIGMLALTYSKIQNKGAVAVIYKSDDIPIGRIRNVD